jgi:hypothetical protein
MPASRFVTLDSAAFGAGAPGRPWGHYEAGTMDYHMARRLRTKGQHLLLLGGGASIGWVDEVVGWRQVVGPLRYPKAKTVDIATLRLRIGMDYDGEVLVTSRARPFAEHSPAIISVSGGGAYQDLGPYDLPLTRGASTEDLSIFARQVGVDSTPALTGTTGGGYRFYPYFAASTGGLTPHAYRNYLFRLYSGGNLTRQGRVWDNDDTLILYDYLPDATVAKIHEKLQSFAEGTDDTIDLFNPCLFGFGGLQLIGRRN